MPGPTQRLGFGPALPEEAGLAPSLLAAQAVANPLAFLAAPKESAMPQDAPAGPGPKASLGTPPTGDDLAEFMKIHEFTARQEGGFADNPKDRGGTTMRGVAVNKIDPSYPDAQKLAREVKAGTLSEEDAARYMKWRYYDRTGLAKVEDPAVRGMLYDWAVNAGEGSMARHAYTVAKVKNPNRDRGDVGEQAAAALNEKVRAQGPKAVARELLRWRSNARRQTIDRNPTDVEFADGWARRDREAAIRAGLSLAEAKAIQDEFFPLTEDEAAYLRGIREKAGRDPKTGLTPSELSALPGAKLLRLG